MLDFLTHLERARGLARNTREAYLVDLLQFGAFLAGRGVGALAADRTKVAGSSKSRWAAAPRRRRRRLCAARPPVCVRSTVTCTAPG